MIKAVILDIDGTLIDSVDLHAHAWREILAEYGHDVPFDAVRSQIGKGGDQLLPVFLSEAEIKEYGDRIGRERSELFKEKYLAKVAPFPMVPDLFKKLRGEGKQIALATSGKKAEVKHYLEIAGVVDLYDVCTTSDDADRSKPHPDIFEAALKKLKDVSPAEALAIGDTPYDAEAAGKLGLRTIGVLCGGFAETDLRKAGCSWIYEGPADLLARYDQSPIARG